MRVTITGGAGKLGRAVVAELKSRGTPSSSLTRLIHRNSASLGFSGSALDFGTMKNAAVRADAVLHLAGIPANGIVPDYQTFSVNTPGTFNCTAVCRMGNDNPETAEGNVG